MKASLVLLDAFPSAVVAEMVKDRLEAEGIRAFVDSENAAHLFAGVEAVMGGVRVVVPPEQLEEARGVLANLSHPLGTAVPDLSEEELAVLAAESEGETEGEAGTEAQPPARADRRLRLLFLVAGAGAVLVALLWVLVKAGAGR